MCLMKKVKNKIISREIVNSLNFHDVSIFVKETHHRLEITKNMNSLQICLEGFQCRRDI